MSWLRPRRSACALLCWSALACGGERPELDQASAALQRHREPFVALDRWVRRAIRSADILRDDRALAETLWEATQPPDPNTGEHPAPQRLEA